MEELLLKASKAKEIANKLGALTSEEKNDALRLISEELKQSKMFIIEENKKDIKKGKETGLSTALVDRLTLTEERIADMAEGLKLVADLDDPIGKSISETRRPNGLVINKVRVPIGVIGMIYEARPNVTIDAASLCLKSGNASLLRGSSSAIHSNKALVHVMHEALMKSKVPLEAIQLIEDTRRETAEKMFTLNEYIDVLIPRGGASLIQTVVEKASIPVLETGAGNCHVYIDESADKKKATDILINAKTQRPSVCNAAETVIIHEGWAKENFVRLVGNLLESGVMVKGDAAAYELDPRISLASKEDWGEEFLDLTLAVKTVSSLDEATEHIAKYGTKHSEAIISESMENVEEFFTYVDAAVLYHNASTRFTDGFEFGFGAEIGISTQKLHARGPMGLEELTSIKYLVLGTGQTK